MKLTIFQIGFQIILGFFIADFVSGLFHWFEDTYLDYCLNIPFIGDISKHNELHHYFPRSMLVYSTLETVSTTLPFIIVIIFCFVIYYKFFNKKIANYFYILFSFFFFISISNLIHKYSHMRDCERNDIITIIQKNWTSMFT